MERELRIKVHELAKNIKKYNKYFNLSLFFDAFEFAMNAHEGQFRKSGESYIWHPFHVVEILVGYEADEITIIAALLHDVLEDTDIPKKKIEEAFGSEVVEVIDGVTKLGRLSFSSDEQEKVENFRKMFLAMAKDIRVIIIKLADRLHNMRTLKFLDEDRRRRIAKETMDIYAPLSHRLGMSNIKWELEDLCFRYLYEEDYQKLKREISEKREEREQYIDEFVLSVHQLLQDSTATLQVTGRAKHFWSIYNKMLKQRTSIRNLYDLYAIRIVVGSLTECYTALGLIHNEFKPIPGRFKDYIAMPKQNMYQSLHTVVMGPGGKPVEVQIRTDEMHKISEFGIAAHWRYKEGKIKEDTFEKKLAWLRELIDWQKEVDDKDFYEDLKFDLFTDEIFVFTPKGHVVELPVSATPIDFAYRVHTEIGHRCVGAKVNGQIVNLGAGLSNGDIVEIITSNESRPKLAWLNIARTSSSKSKIRQWFKKHTDVFDDAHDEDAPKKPVRPEPEPLPPQESRNMEIPVVTRKVERKGSIGVLIQGTDDVMSFLSRCCNPMPGDDILGYVTRNRGVAVHRKDCANIKRVEQNRIVDATWDSTFTGSYDVAIEAEGSDRVGLLNDIVAKITEQKINIVNGSIRTTSEGKAYVHLILSLTNMETLDSIMNRIRAVKGLQTVHRRGGH